MAYEDEGQLLVEFYPDADGEPRLYDVADLQRVLDTVGAMLGTEPRPGRMPSAPSCPNGPRASTPWTPSPPSSMSAPLRRGPEDEGFYPPEAAAGIINRCSDLGLAVVAIEGFTLHSDREERVPGCAADLGAAYRGEPWSAFLAGCNLQAMTLLERWPRRASFAISFEVQDATGEVFVL